jgi:hypothetical protein
MQRPAIDDEGMDIDENYPSQGTELSYSFASSGPSGSRSRHAGFKAAQHAFPDGPNRRMTNSTFFSDFDDDFCEDDMAL